MADEDIQYASVVFKNKKQPQSKSPKKEETIYDEVKIQNETLQESSDSKELLSEKEAERRRHYQKLACCLGTFCSLLVLGIIGITVYQSKIHNLTMENQELKEKNQNLTKQTQNLEGETRILREQIDNMTKTHNELNVSRAQWSIDEYCRKDRERKCESCQKGWNLFSSSCYAYNDAKLAGQKNWDEAQQDCNGKVSHLLVVANQEEKNYVNTICPAGTDIKGYWIGLRAEGKKWKWINGTELANQDWITTTASDGQCVTCLKDTNWTSVSCTEKRNWICEKKALSV